MRHKVIVHAVDDQSPPGMRVAWTLARKVAQKWAEQISQAHHYMTHWNADCSACQVWRKPGTAAGDDDNGDGNHATAEDANNGNEGVADDNKGAVLFPMNVRTPRRDDNAGSAAHPWKYYPSLRRRVAGFVWVDKQGRAHCVVKDGSPCAFYAEMYVTTRASL